MSYPQNSEEAAAIKLDVSGMVKNDGENVTFEMTTKQVLIVAVAGALAIGMLGYLAGKANS